MPSAEANPNSVEQTRKPNPNRRKGGRRKHIRMRYAVQADRSDVRTRGPIPAIAEITTAQLEEVVGEILGGITPYVASCMVLGISNTTHFRWMNEGRDPKSPKPYQDYYNEIHRAEMQLRGGLEKRIYTRNAEFYASHSPSMRTKPEAPGWTPEVVERHADFSGEKSPEWEIRFTSFGPRSQRVIELEPDKPKEIGE